MKGAMRVYSCLLAVALFAPSAMAQGRSAIRCSSHPYAIQCDVHEDAVVITSIELNRGRCDYTKFTTEDLQTIRTAFAERPDLIGKLGIAPPDTMEERIERTKDAVAYLPNFSPYLSSDDRKLVKLAQDVGAALSNYRSDPRRAYRFGDRVTIRHTCPNLLEYIIATTENAWKWEVQ